VALGEVARIARSGVAREVRRGGARHDPGLQEPAILWSNIPEGARSQMFSDAAAKLPVRRIGKPADIAEHYIGFMRGAYVTGQALVVDGGGVLV
jgi:NAD(P)-dependent dehydrogenase (short-subunit alcohol dehydrogenase family)